MEFVIAVEIIVNEHSHKISVTAMQKSSELEVCQSIEKAKIKLIKQLTEMNELTGVLECILCPQNVQL